MGTDKGYTGQFQDAATGLDYYNARYYDPVIGQFLSADQVQVDGQDKTTKGDSPSQDKKQDNKSQTSTSQSSKQVQTQGNPQGMNPYAYVMNNPEVNTDPTGLSSCGKKCQYIRTFAEGGASQFRELASEVQNLINLLSNGNISGVSSFASLIFGILSFLGKVALGMGLAGIVLSLAGVGSWVWTNLLQDYRSVLLQMADDYHHLALQYNDSMDWETETGFGRYGTSEIDGFANGELTNMAQREESMHWHETEWDFIDSPAVALFQTYIGVMDGRASINILNVRDQMIGCSCADNYMLN